MPKYYGKVGYAVTSETSPGVWTSDPVERTYYGDVLKNGRRFEQGEAVNDDIRLENRFSILADPYAYEHFWAIRYIEWMGALWKVTNVEVESPRLILSIGGPYNGPRASETRTA